MKKILFFLTYLICSSMVFGQSENYTIKNIKANKKFQDFGVSYYGDSTVVFSSSGKSVFMKRVWSGNQEPFLSLFQGDIQEDGEITNVKKFGKSLDTKFHESNLSFTKDLKTVYFSRNNYYNKKYKTDSVGVNLIQIYKAQINEKGAWGNIETLPFNSDQYDTGHPCLNKDETKLYFVSNMPGTLGDTDVFYVDILSDGTYGTPINLGAKVNTTKKEMFPFIDENDILYFSSNGFIDNNGGLDIYATKLRGKEDYYTPVNLGLPINSNKDDFSFVKKSASQTGYFASNRDGGKGDDDIYAFVEKTPIQFDCPETITGIITSTKNNKALPFSVVTIYTENKQISSIVTGEDGMYSFNVQCKSNYKIVASKTHFEQDEKNVVTNTEEDLKVNLALTPKKNEHFVEVRDQVMLNIKPIFFDYNKASIRSDSESELKMVTELMTKYPDIIIQVRAHTDSRGNDSHNLTLSEKRAKSTMKWLLDNGIESTRVFASGFGEKQLVNECEDGVKCSKEKHQENRRTEFVILNPDMVGR